ncbi:hypothetical protein FKP32DRAFT_912206 [Trametes sanguinea]|nr:hypothetical protein FKP32DRAFT_912206 [Trametes sanguinea]
MEVRQCRQATAQFSLKVALSRSMRSQPTCSRAIAALFGAYLKVDLSSCPTLTRSGSGTTYVQPRNGISSELPEYINVKANYPGKFLPQAPSIVSCPYAELHHQNAARTPCRDSRTRSPLWPPPSHSLASHVLRPSGPARPLPTSSRYSLAAHRCQLYNMVPSPTKCLLRIQPCTHYAIYSTSPSMIYMMKCANQNSGSSSSP